MYKIIRQFGDNLALSSTCAFLSLVFILDAMPVGLIGYDTTVRDVGIPVCVQ